MFTFQQQEQCPLIMIIVEEAVVAASLVEDTTALHVVTAGGTAIARTTTRIVASVLTKSNVTILETRFVPGATVLVFLGAEEVVEEALVTMGPLVGSAGGIVVARTTAPIVVSVLTKRNATIQEIHFVPGITLLALLRAGEEEEVEAEEVEVEEVHLSMILA